MAATAPDQKCLLEFTAAAPRPEGTTFSLSNNTFLIPKSPSSSPPLTLEVIVVVVIAVQSFKLIDEKPPLNDTDTEETARFDLIETAEFREGEFEMQLRKEGGIMGSRKRPPAKIYGGYGGVAVYCRAKVSEVGIE